MKNLQKIKDKLQTQTEVEQHCNLYMNLPFIQTFASATFLFLNNHSSKFYIEQLLEKTNIKMQILYIMTMTIMIWNKTTLHTNKCKKKAFIKNKS